ncbi:MAG: ATP-dependent zinc metalloprotease FtsH [Clostridiaceae bacterium]|nr:ATP-dependent zinc metalloprotease FtsH [Clostridiaceae bacterium]
MKKLKIKFVILPIILAVLSLLALVVGNINQKPINSEQYVNFMKDLSERKISSVYLTTSPKILVELKNNIKYETDNPRSDKFKETLLQSGVKVFEQEPIPLNTLIPMCGLILSIIFLLFYSFKSHKVTAKGLFSVDKLDANEVFNLPFSFESIAGNEEAKESVKDVVDFLKNPEKYSAYGARMPRGIILYGEPGTGKTLLAKAISAEAGVPFYAMSGSDFVQIYVGVGASRIRQLFKKAKANGKAVIFIDEIDAIGKKRSNSKGGNSDEKDQTLNALLTEMSGFNESEGIIVLAATNRLDMLDPALLRPGRFDRHIEVSLPDVSAREKILNLHLKNKPVGNININEWAHKTTYFSGAKLENLINEAAILACKDDNKYIDERHVDQAYSIVVAGYEKVNRDYIKENDRKITAYHEAGHALVSMNILPMEKISKVTIIPTSKGAGGYTLSIPEDQLYQNKSYLNKRIMVLLGGRAAEEIIFGCENITTGAYSDLKSSTSIIANMVTEYGMGDSLGLLSLQEISTLNIQSGNDILDECKALVNSLYAETKKLIQDNIEDLEKIAVKLIEKETIHEKDLKQIVFDI